MQVSTSTHVGMVREQNEDSFLSMPELALFAVADGMGGHRGGKTASQLIVSELRELAETEAPQKSMDLASMLTRINLRIREVAAADPSLEGMGSTCSAVVIRGGRLYVAHVGDSRVYLMRNDQLQQVTLDHRAIQKLIDEGTLSEAEAEFHPWRNILTRSMGAEDKVEIDLYERDLQAGDEIMICSDGLTGMLPEPNILDILSAGEDLQATADRLVAGANENGGADNITVVLIRIG